MHGCVEAGELGKAADLAVLTGLMDLSSQVAAHGEALCSTEETSRGMTLMEIADRLADEVGVLADGSGYTMDEVMAPLWQRTTEETPQAE